MGFRRHVDVVNPQGQMSRRRFVRDAVVLASGLTALTPTASATGQAKRGGILRYGAEDPVTSLDPHVFTEDVHDALLGMVYSRLVEISPDWNTFEPDLATRWEISADGKAYTFHLRPNVKFHDGSAFSADDVVFSFQRIMDPKTGAFVRPLLADALSQVTAPDQATVRFVMKQPYAALLAAVSLPTASIISKSWVTAGGNLTLTQMGTGPMRFVSLEPGVKIVVERNPQYYDRTQPYLDGVLFQFIADDTARSTALRTGAVDFISFVPYQDMVAIAADPNLQLHGDASSSGEWAFPNLKRPPMDNVLIRQALNWAVNRQAILQAAFLGHGAIMDTVFMPTSWWPYTADLPKYSYDPDRAKDLIKQSGLKMPLRVQMLTNSSPFHKGSMTVFQANLQDIGFDAQLSAPEYAEFYKQFVAGQYDISTWGGGPAYPDPDFLYAYFDSDGTIGRTTGYANPKLNALLEQARVTSSRPARKALYIQVYKILLDDAPWFPFVYREQADASAKYVQGYQRVWGTNWNGYRMARTWLSK